MEKEYTPPKHDLQSVVYDIIDTVKKLQSIQGRLEREVENGGKMTRELYGEILEDVSRFTTRVGYLHTSIREAYVYDNPELFKHRDVYAWLNYIYTGSDTSK